MKHKVLFFVMEREETDDTPWSPKGEKKTPMRSPPSRNEGEGRELSFSLSPQGKSEGKTSNVLDRLKKTKESGVKTVSPERNPQTEKWTTGPFSPTRRIPKNTLYLDADYLIDSESVREVIASLGKRLQQKYGFAIVHDPDFAYYVAIVLVTDQTTYYDNEEDESWVDCRLVEQDRALINRTLSRDDGTIFFIAITDPRSEFHPLPSLCERVFSFGAKFSLGLGYDFLKGFGPRTGILQSYKPGTCVLGQFYEKTDGNESIGVQLEEALEDNGFHVVTSFQESSCGAVFIDMETFRQNKERLVESSKMYNDNMLYRWFLVVYYGTGTAAGGAEEDPNAAVGGVEDLECYFFSLDTGLFRNNINPKPRQEVLKINQKICSRCNINAAYAQCNTCSAPFCSDRCFEKSHLGSRCKLQKK